MSYQFSTIKYLDSDSDDSLIRYTLGTPNAGCPLIIVGVNPSYATPTRSDPTVANADFLAKNHGFDGWTMLNLYPVRNPNPNKLPKRRSLQSYNSNITHIIGVIEKFSFPSILLAFGDIIEKRKYLSRSFCDIYQGISTRPEIEPQWLFPRLPGTTGILTKGGNPRHLNPHRRYDLEQVRLESADALILDLIQKHRAIIGP